MGIYSHKIFPRLLDFALGNSAAQKLRQKTLAQASGSVIEIGFGTGLNLPFYPKEIHHITALDSEDFLPDLVAARIKQSGLQIDRVQLDAAGNLPFAENSFDTVVSTWTMCSIANIHGALLEMRRILKPSGKLLFCEHGRSDEAKTAKWQDRLNPIQNIIGCGCHINRQISNLITQAGFEIEELDRFVMKDSPRIMGEMYRGSAKVQ
jgi:ubiquinone/menaquinone biosynthesis C-methylase UbiE